LAELHLDITHPLQARREEKLLCLIFPQAALPVLFPRKETFHAPLPLKFTKAEPGSFFHLPQRKRPPNNGAVLSLHFSMAPKSPDSVRK